MHAKTLTELIVPTGINCSRKIIPKGEIIRLPADVITDHGWENQIEVIEPACGLDLFTGNGSRCGRMK